MTIYTAAQLLEIVRKKKSQQTPSRDTVTHTAQTDLAFATAASR
jgi:hypothetical protein